MNEKLLSINYIPTENEEDLLYKLRKNKKLNLNELNSDERYTVAHLAHEVGIIYVDGDYVYFDSNYINTDALFEELWNICPERSENPELSQKLFNSARISGYPARKIIEARRKYVTEQIKNCTGEPRYKYVKNLLEWLSNERYRIDNAEKISIDEIANEVETFEK
jgi:hypothetical protein